MARVNFILPTGVEAFLLSIIQMVTLAFCLVTQFCCDMPSHAERTHSLLFLLVPKHCIPQWTQFCPGVFWCVVLHDQRTGDEETKALCAGALRLFARRRSAISTAT